MGLDDDAVKEPGSTRTVKESKERSKMLGHKKSALDFTSYTPMMQVNKSEEKLVEKELDSTNPYDRSKAEQRINKNYAPSGGMHDPHASLGCGHQDRNHK